MGAVSDASAILVPLSASPRWTCSGSPPSGGLICPYVDTPTALPIAETVADPQKAAAEITSEIRPTA